MNPFGQHDPPASPPPGAEDTGHGAARADALGGSPPEPPAPGDPAAAAGAGDDDAAKTQAMSSHRLTQLGPFSIETKIGEGGMGVVYRAYDPDLHRMVAIKRVHARYMGDEEYAQRFLTEARAVAATVHPNIAQIFSIHARDADSPPYFVMEFVDGESAEERVTRGGPLSPVEAVEVTLQSARGLRAAAQKGIVHRDVKPSNILLTRRGEVKLVDFGLARRTEELPSITQVGVVLGTPHYVSPEQGRGRAVDHRSDIYSLGCTLFYLLTGREPFQGQTKVEIIVAHANEPPPRLAAHLPEPPPRALEELLARMLAKQPEERYQDYDTLLADLEALRTQLGQRLRSRHQRLVRRLGLLGTATALTLAVVFAATRSGRPGRPAWAYSPEAYFGSAYTAHAEGREILEYDFADAALQRFFRYPPRGLDSGPVQPPLVRERALEWQNFDGELFFPYLERFDFVELHGLEFRGEPDFELVVGSDPLRPENRLRLALGVGTKNRDVLECWHLGERLAIPSDPRQSDFTLNDRERYKLRLARVSGGAAAGDPTRPAEVIELVIEQQHAQGVSERERIRFQLPAGVLPRGGITLRCAGLGEWRVAVRDVIISGRLDHDRIGKELVN